MFTNRRDQRNRREAVFTLESLDDRLVLSATAAAAVAPHAAAVEQRHEAMIARHEARHEARLARVEARHEARLARMQARHIMPASTPMIPAPMAPAASTSTASTTTATTVTGTATPTAATPAATMNTAISVVPTSTAVPTSSSSSSSTTSASSTSTGTGSSTLPSNVAASLQALYTEYESSSGGNDFKPSLPSDTMLQISGDSVAVSLKIDSSGSFNSAMSTLQSDGMKITASSSTYGLINGMLPIAELPAAASVASSVAPATAPLPYL